MRSLIFGGDGFLGANLAAYLMAKGHEVTVTALNRKHETSLDALMVRCRVEYGDVLDTSFVERVVNAYEAQWVFHLAAVSIVRIAEVSPARAIRTNVMGTLNVLEACNHSRNVDSVVVASSDKAYGYQKGIPYREDGPLTPTGAYEVSKACADMIARLYGPPTGMDVTVTRCANLFGPGDLNWSRLIPGACRQAVNGEPPIVHPGSWLHQREWLDVTSACEAYVLLAERGLGGDAYNVGSGKTYRTGELASLIAMQMGTPLPMRQEGTAKFQEIPSQVLDSSKIGTLGWRPNPEPEKALHETVQWYANYLGARKCLRC